MQKTINMLNNSPPGNNRRKKLIINFLIVLMAILCFHGCDNSGETDNSHVDAISTATPNGGILKPAEEGPERSALGVPTIDLNTFRLEVTGLVDSSYSLTWKEIQSMPSYITDTIIMYCVEGWEVWGDWEGISLYDLVSRAHLQTGAEYILFTCVDGYSTALPISDLINTFAILAYRVNGYPLKEHDGFPLRLIAFGKYGYKWAKWVTKLEVMDQSQLGYWEYQGYSDEADVPIERRRRYEDIK
jgi:DMSO/TMAO reductase YedYZ molybdopterin-dependent catalytic subunit